MDFTPLSVATHVSASFSPNSAEAPFPEINVIPAVLRPPPRATSWPSTTPSELFDALCDAYDADLLGVSLPLPAARAASGDGIGALIGFELLPVVGSDPFRARGRDDRACRRRAAHRLTVTVPGVDD